MELKKIYITMELGFCCVNFCSERKKKKTKFGRGAREVNWQIFQMKFGRHFIVSKTQFFLLEMKVMVKFSIFEFH